MGYQAACVYMWTLQGEMEKWTRGREETGIGGPGLSWLKEVVTCTAML